MTTVSVAMATYNGAQYIGEQLRSLAAQTLAPAELVITDDGSTDDTLRIAAEFARTAPFPVRIEPNAERLGYRANFMRAASLCTGEFVAFCDQDDVWEARKLATCLKLFEDPEVLLVYHDAVTIDADERPIGTLARRAPPQRINPPLSIYPWLIGSGFTQVYRNAPPLTAKRWESSWDHFEPRQRMAQDQWFFFLASALGSIAYIDEPLALYRQHGQNVYGWGGQRKASLLARLLSTNGAHGSDPMERASLMRAEILEQMAPELASPWSGRAATAAARYRRLARQLAARRRLYTESSLARRAAALTELLRGGGYDRHDRWSFSPSSLVKDASLGICAGPRLARS